MNINLNVLTHASKQFLHAFLFYSYYYTLKILNTIIHAAWHICLSSTITIDSRIFLAENLEKATDSDAHPWVDCGPRILFVRHPKKVVLPGLTLPAHFHKTMPIDISTGKCLSNVPIACKGLFPVRLQAVANSGSVLYVMSPPDCHRHYKSSILMYHKSPRHSILDNREYRDRDSLLMRCARCKCLSQKLNH